MGMKRFVERIRFIVSTFQNFKLHVENRTVTLIGTVEKAIAAIHQFTLTEIRSVTNIATQYKQNNYRLSDRYVNDLLPMELLWSHFDHYVAMAAGMREQCMETRYRHIVEILRMGIFHIDGVLEQVDFMKVSNQMCPRHFWMHRDNLPKCDISFKEISDSLHNVTDLLGQMCSGSGNDTNDIYNDISLLHETVKKELEGMTHCNFDFISVLQNATQIHKDIENDIKKEMNTKLIFDYSIVLRKFRNELRDIGKLEKELTTLLTSYTRNETTKLEIAKRISMLNVLSGGTPFDRILWQLEEKVFGRFAFKIKTMEYNVRQWLMSGIRSMVVLVPFCHGDVVENAIRKLNIWRNPVVNLDAREFIVYSLKPGETWRTWPTATSFVELVEIGHDSNILHDITRSFGEALIEPINGLKSDMHRAFSEIKTSISDLKDDLGKFRIDNTLNNNFIM